MGQFPNAKNGVSKVYIAQILSLIVSVIGLISILAMFLGSTGGIITGGIGVLVVGILGIVAFILELIGVVKMRNENSKLNAAFILTIVGIVTTAFQNMSGAFGTIMDIATSIIEVLIIVFICQGIALLLDQEGQSELAEKGNKTAVLSGVAYGIGTIGSSIITVITGSTAAVVIGVLFAIIFFVLDIVAYVMYLSFLKHSKEVL